MTIGWHFDNTYSKLSNTFKEDIKPTPVHDPELIILNEKLAKDLNLDFSKIEKKMHQIISRNAKFIRETWSREEALDYFCTDGLIILHDDKILYEEYWNGNDRYSKHISWSVAKSFLSALIGIALDEGLIDSIEDPATKYLPDFKGTGYE